MYVVLVVCGNIKNINKFSFSKIIQYKLIKKLTNTKLIIYNFFIQNSVRNKYNFCIHIYIYISIFK